MKLISCFTCATLALMFSAGICNAQTLNLKSAPKTVAIDGDAKEWSDSLDYTNNTVKLNYTLANDKDNLYLVVKTKAKDIQGDILGSGVTLSIDTKDRKRSTYAVTFPVSGDDAIGYINMNADQIKLKVQYIRFKKIKAEGFKDIDEPLLTTDNTNGIKVAITYDTNGYLIYEEAIPLNLFHAGDLISKEWAFNIKLNGLQSHIVEESHIISQEIVGVPSNGSRRSSLTSDMQPNANNPFQDKTQDVQLTPALDFWGKFNLAKTQ